jgi:hypothetical protein
MNGLFRAEKQGGGGRSVTEWIERRDESGLEYPSVHASLILKQRGEGGFYIFWGWVIDIRELWYALGLLATIV